MRGKSLTFLIIKIYYVVLNTALHIGWRSEEQNMLLNPMWPG